MALPAAQARSSMSVASEKRPKRICAAASGVHVCQQINAVDPPTAAQSLDQVLILSVHARPSTFSNDAQWVYLPDGTREGMWGPFRMREFLLHTTRCWCCTFFCGTSWALPTAVPGVHSDPRGPLLPLRDMLGHLLSDVSPAKSEKCGGR